MKEEKNQLQGVESTSLTAQRKALDPRQMRTSMPNTKFR